MVAKNKIPSQRGSQTEAHARTRIENHLRKLGWILDGENQNVYQEGACLTAEQKKSLGRYKPDYILYQTGTHKPLAVIEAKRPNSKKNTLTKALEQGQRYASRIGVDVIFASDSYVTIACRANGDPVLLGNIKIDEFVRESVLLRLGGDLKQTTNIMQSRDKLIKIFNRAEKELRRDGIDAGMEAIYEFCIILFIKINSEIKGDGKWDRLCDQTRKTIMGEFKNIIEEYKKLYKGIFREMKINSPGVMLNIVSMLKGINLVDTDIDIKGEAYEHFLKRYSSQTKSVLGQYYTPRHITDMIAIYLDPYPGEKIYDPFCGTGGMLISCFRYMLNHVSTDKELKLLKRHTLYGNDINNGASQLAQMNMIVIGDGHTNISRLDSLQPNKRKDRKYDKAVTNIPFNLRGDYQMNPNILCILKCLNSIKVGGEAFIIVPENICYQDSYAGGRKLILKEARLNAVVHLPRATFKSYTTARTCILHFTDIGKNKKTKTFPYIEIEHDGFSDSTWREPIEKNDIPKFLENKNNLASVYPNLELDEGFRFVPDEQEDEFFSNYWLLKEIVEEKPVFDLEPNKEYKEPQLNSRTNTIAQRGKMRLGRNFRGKAKKLIEPGDLVIATLHTQSGNGLFAISDDYYVGESQLIVKIKTELVTEDYLVFALRRILPKLEVNDLVGRETFRKEDLLNIRIPKQPRWFKSKKYLDGIREMKRLSAMLTKRRTQAIDKAFDSARVKG